MLEVATVTPELDDSASATPLLASVTANALISVTSMTLMVMVSRTELVPSLAVKVIVYEVVVS